MTQPDFDSFLWHIWKTEDEEISCTECFDLVPQYVDLEIAGGITNDTLPGLKQHLDCCAVCREEYETLRDLVRLDDGRSRPAADDGTPPQ
jgi:hypothetical protein